GGPAQAEALGQDDRRQLGEGHAGAFTIPSGVQKRPSRLVARMRALLAALWAGSAYPALLAQMHGVVDQRQRVETGVVVGGSGPRAASGEVRRRPRLSGRTIGDSSARVMRGPSRSRPGSR
ncbi:hypothetical protein CNY89_25085, partial [Amaricoccus sp. HAR-UPW-R2A-40]